MFVISGGGDSETIFKTKFTKFIYYKYFLKLKLTKTKCKKLQ